MPDPAQFDLWRVPTLIAALQSIFAHVVNKTISAKPCEAAVSASLPPAEEEPPVDVWAGVGLLNLPFEVKVQRRYQKFVVRWPRYDIKADFKFSTKPDSCKNMWTSAEDAKQAALDWHARVDKDVNILSNLKVPELRHRCSLQGSPTSGTKADLLTKLLEKTIPKLPTPLQPKPDVPSGEDITHIYEAKPPSTEELEQHTKELNPTGSREDATIWLGSFIFNCEVLHDSNSLVFFLGETKKPYKSLKHDVNIVSTAWTSTSAFGTSLDELQMHGMQTLMSHNPKLRLHGWATLVDKLEIMPQHITFQVSADYINVKFKAHAMFWSCID